jgi:hypothetical protein
MILAFRSACTRAAELGQRLRMQGGALAGKAAKDDPVDRGRRLQRLDRGRDYSATIWMRTARQSG